MTARALVFGVYIGAPDFWKLLNQDTIIWILVYRYVNTYIYMYRCVYVC